MSKDEKSPSNNVSKTENAQVSFLAEFFILAFGSIPMIAICSVCAYVLHKDYVLNNYNFIAQSKLYSNVETYEIYENISCFNQDYANERNNFKKCAPKYCSRYFSDFIATQQDAKVLLNIAKRGFDYAEPTSGITTLNIGNGSLSKDKSFIDIKKILEEKNEKLFSQEEIGVFWNLQNKIKNEIKAKLNVDELYLTEPAFFSKTTSNNVQSSSEEYWNRHVDKKKYKSFVYTSIIYLNNHQLDYYGGRIFFYNIENNSTFSVEPKLGRVLIFTSGSENEHYVERVKTAERYELTLGFTCDKSHELANLS